MSLLLHSSHVIETGELDGAIERPVVGPADAHEFESAAQNFTRGNVEVFVAHRQEGLGDVPRGVPDAIERDDLADAVIVAPDELGHRAPEETLAPRGLKKAGNNDIAGVACEVQNLLAAVA